jgi:hypothetical protein
MERKRGVEDRIVLITISGTEAANSLRWEGFFFLQPVHIIFIRMGAKVGSKRTAVFL